MYKNVTKITENYCDTTILYNFRKSIQVSKKCSDPKFRENLTIPETYSVPCQTFKMESFTQIVNGLQPLTIYIKHSILYVS